MARFSRTRRGLFSTAGSQRGSFQSQFHRLQIKREKTPAEARYQTQRRARRQRQIHQSGVDRRLPWRNSGLLWSTDCYISGYGPLQQTNGGTCRYSDAILHHQHTPIHTGIDHYQFARRCNAWRSLRQRRSFSSRSTRSRDLLQWAVGLQHQRQRRLFTLKAEVAA